MKVDRKRGWKKAVIDRCRSLLHSPGPITGVDDEFLREVIASHPEADSKIGCGIDHFEVKGNEWGGRTFWLVRIDGTSTDFSFMKSLNPPTPLRDFISACRSAVVPDILAFKNSVFDVAETVVCPVSGETVTRDTGHVDHAPPGLFDVIARDFAGRFPNIAAVIEPTRDGSLVTTFADEVVAEEFRRFHAGVARLRIVSRRANLSILKRSAIKVPS